MDMRNSPIADAMPVLSRTADYALRAILVLARREVGGPIAADEIARLTGAPPNYLGKTLQALAKAGLVRGTRGPTGGFVLALAPGEITIERIGQVFAQPATPRQCLLGTGLCNAAAPCAAHANWHRLAGATREPLAATTIADLLAGPHPELEA